MANCTVVVEELRLSHTRPVAAATFDDPNLMSTAGLIPVMALSRPAACFLSPISS
jgi:hypothetical protein